jgi:hypothetical protein
MFLYILTSSTGNNTANWQTFLLSFYLIACPSLLFPSLYLLSYCRILPNIAGLPSLQVSLPSFSPGSSPSSHATASADVAEYFDSSHSSPPDSTSLSFPPAAAYARNHQTAVPPVPLGSPTRSDLLLGYLTWNNQITKLSTLSITSSPLPRCQLPRFSVHTLFAIALPDYGSSYDGQHRATQLSLGSLVSWTTPDCRGQGFNTGSKIRLRHINRLRHIFLPFGAHHHWSHHLHSPICNLRFLCLSISFLDASYGRIGSGRFGCV